MLISLKKQVKVDQLNFFFNKYSYIFVLNDLSLNTQSLLLNFIESKGDLNAQKMVIKSKLLLKILENHNILGVSQISIKGPVILIGVNDLISFRLLLNFIELGNNSNNLDLLFLIMNNKFISKDSIKNVFGIFFKNITFLKYYNSVNLKYRREFLNSLLFSTFFIESKLMNLLKLK